MSQHTDRFGNSLHVGDFIHGNLWHQRRKHLHRVAAFSKPAPSPHRLGRSAGQTPDETMIRVAGGWVRFNDACKVCEPSKCLVDQKRMDELIHADAHYDALLAAGVDNWEEGGGVLNYLKAHPCPCSECAAERKEDEE